MQYTTDKIEIIIQIIGEEPVIRLDPDHAFIWFDWLNVPENKALEALSYGGSMQRTLYGGEPHYDIKYLEYVKYCKKKQPKVKKIDDMTQREFMAILPSCN